MTSELDLFTHQYHHCSPYRQWCDLLHTTPDSVQNATQIPFLPIEFFRSHRVYGANTPEELVFASSGTTSDQTSHHYVAHAQKYIDAFEAGFRQFYGDPSQYSIFALLPGYLERPDSSLVYMVEHLHKANVNAGGFFLNDLDGFGNALMAATERKEQIFVIGVTFALVEFSRRNNVQLPENAVVMETGGMKGHGRAIERVELHKLLRGAFGVKDIHSEYGMTELLSQAYSSGNGVFRPANTMRVVGRSLSDPLSLRRPGNELVGLNIIDFANEDSCSFIATGDCGRVFDDGSFEVAGRIEGEILRGCNMLA